MTYDQFLSQKIPAPKCHGFTPELPLHESLYDWQKVIVRWSIKQGRCALFEDCGLGKTFQQLEWSHHIHCKTREPILILSPLAVAPQTVKEGNHFGYQVKIVESNADVINGINITNYQKLDRFDTSKFIGIVLDESSILKNLTGKTRLKLTELFNDTPYRLCCTATPAPNDYTELGQHAEFLGVCKTSEMLATYFINDTSDTGTWRLKGHAIKPFWQWVSSWAACVTKPSDLGFDDAGFILPKLNLEVITVDVDESSNTDDGWLIRMPTMSSTNMHKEMRLTCSHRAQKAAELIQSKPNEPWVIWCNTDYESNELSKLISGGVEVKGSDKDDDKIEALNLFSTGKIKRMITKPKIAGLGLNWQHCWNHVFVGMSYSFEQFYQALRRGYRYGQSHEFNAYIIQAQTEGVILSAVQEKMAKHREMQEEMKFASECLMENTNDFVNLNTHVKREKGEGWELYHGDCVRVAQTLKSDSIHFSIFSPPFSDLFVYSSDLQDMGNTKDLDQFMEQFNFLVEQLYRITIPGRLCAIHCSDLISAKWKDGVIENKNFTGKIVDCFVDYGWQFQPRITIWKDPVLEMTRTKALGLLHKQLKKDSSRSRVGLAEYILTFCKPGENLEPISHDDESYPVELWQKDASPVWMDIKQTKVLNTECAMDTQDEKHMCPLQLDTINRCLRLWTNPGDLVFSPFAGIGSEGYCSLKMGRRFVGAELKESYFKNAVGYLKSAYSESLTLNI